MIRVVPPFGTTLAAGITGVHRTPRNAYRGPMHRRTLLLTLVAALVTLFALSSTGCKSKKTLDADVDHLLVAIARSDYEHFKADAHPALVNEVSKDEFESMAMVLKRLGPLKSKTMKSISVRQGAPTEGQYDMEFENGSCSLAIKSLDGKLVGFHFEGPDIKRLQNAP